MGKRRAASCCKITPDPAVYIKIMNQSKYLEQHIFTGLENLNDGFDSQAIFYCSESDFEVVLNRVEQLGIGILGIEPWLDGEFYDVLSCTDYGAAPTDPSWYRKAFDDFKARDQNLMYAASYQVQEGVVERK